MTTLGEVPEDDSINVALWGQRIGQHHATSYVLHDTAEIKKNLEIDDIPKVQLSQIEQKAIRVFLDCRENRALFERLNNELNGLIERLPYQKRKGVLFFVMDHIKNACENYSLLQSEL